MRRPFQTSSEQKSASSEKLALLNFLVEAGES
jgi:hypothetical protein